MVLNPGKEEINMNNETEWLKTYKLLRRWIAIALGFLILYEIVIIFFIPYPVLSIQQHIAIIVAITIQIIIQVITRPSAMVCSPKIDALLKKP